MGEHWTVDKHGHNVIEQREDGVATVATLQPHARIKERAVLIATAPTLKAQNERLKARVAELEKLIRPLMENSLLAEDALSDIADDDGTIVPLRLNLVTAAEKARAALKQGENNDPSN